ncbi:MAG: trypsin-like peptidase domain-containing protein [Planctomycetota bacterium]
MSLSPTPASLLFGLCIALSSAATLPAQGLKPPHLLEKAPSEPDEIDLRTTPVVRAVQRAADSVVSVYILDATSRQPQEALEGQGSGVIVDDSGLVITNWHVVTPIVLQPGRHQVEVRLRDERKFEATVLSSSSEHDLALLQLALHGETVKPVTAGSSAGLMIGETVIAIGNPEGQANTVTQGVLSAINRSINVRAPDGQVRRYEGLLQTDAAINRGNSGGALLDITGKLIGINNAMAVGVENIGFAIPVDTVKRVFQDVLLSADNLASVWIGARVEDVEGAPVVTAVTPASPAAQAGFQRGDRITRVLDRDVRSALDYTRMLASAKPGEEVPFVLQRGPDAMTLRARAMSNMERELSLRTGLSLESVDANADGELVRRATQLFYAGSPYRRVPSLRSVLRVREVAPDSPAADLGLEKDDVILGTRVRDYFDIRSVPLSTIRDFNDIARQFSGETMSLLVMRKGEALEGPLDVKRL